MKKINLSQLKKKLSDNDFQAVVDAAYKNSFGDASLKNSTLRFESIVNNIEDKSIKSRVSSLNVDFAVAQELFRDHIVAQYPVDCVSQ